MTVVWVLLGVLVFALYALGFSLAGMAKRADQGSERS